ncbi:MAG: F0F1 ATP synthase subunit alpha [Hyphomicrobiaceae bacterium]
MPTIRDELRGWLADAPHALSALDLRARIEHVGTVSRIGDLVASIDGLPNTRLGEVLRFDGGALGIALSVEVEHVECVLLDSGQGISAGTKVRGTGDIVRTPVGPSLLGRIIDALGRPRDEVGPIRAETHEPIERPAPGILERDLIREPLMTGLTVIDSMIPLGRGQRALLMGDRKTGKTAVAVDAVINQKTTDTICIYALIGQKSSTIEQVVDAVRTHGAMERCIFVVGEASDPPGVQWLVPYAACTVAEYFRDRGQHALLILDDLTRHAIVYREISLLLRRPPGREAYPGDIFYIHSRLLERAAKLSKDRGGGSLTALPIVETQAGNLSAYIPTNLISITDGQIYFEPKLFYEGQKPAVNVGLSVSRVGAKTQAAAIRQRAANLKLQYAQFIELEVFTRFGAMVDERTQDRIEHGRRIRAILAQPQFTPRSLAVQTSLLLALESHCLDQLSLSQVETFKTRIGRHLDRNCPHVSARLDRFQSIEPADEAELRSAIDQLVADISGRQSEVDVDGTTGAP